LHKTFATWRLCAKEWLGFNILFRAKPQRTLSIYIQRTQINMKLIHNMQFLSIAELTG